MADSQSYDQRERFDDREEATRLAQDAHRADIWTALPVIIKKHDRDKNTAHVQPVTKLKHVKADGTVEWKDFPILEDVPINYHGGGGVSITPPLADGDEGIVIFSSRGFDKWWQSGGTQEQDQLRMHDISDGWLIPGGRSQPRKLANISEKTWQLRTDDGKTYVDFDPTTKKCTVNTESDILLKSATQITLEAPKIITKGQTLLGSETASIPVSKQGTVDSAGDTDVSNFAANVLVS